MIKEFFSNKTFLITGATGFLGQPLVEKILWSAPDIRRIYVLIRPKKQFGGRILTAQERMERELYGSSAFDRLQMLYQDELQDLLREKLIAVSGNIAADGLGIPADLASQLRQEVDVVINSAAVVSFDAPLDEALELNVFGAKRVAEFAASCPRAILIHISTAYVCGAAKGVVHETLHHRAPKNSEDSEQPLRAFVDPDREIQQIRTIIREIREKAESPDVRRSFAQAYLQKVRKNRARRRIERRVEISRLRKSWLDAELAKAGMVLARRRGWNDTYTYTKALGEQVVVRSRGNTPTAIIRPSVIESSLSEPSPGWLDGLRMADPLIVAIGKGRLRSLPLNPDVSLDLVPADMVVNATLAQIPQLPGKSDLQILQVATSSRNPITLGELNQLIFAYFQANPMLNKEGRPILIKPLRFPSRTQFRIQHRLRAVPLDTAERTLERLPMFDAAQRVKRKVAASKIANQRLYYYGELYEPYLNLDCQFAVTQTEALFQSLSEEEQHDFNFDVANLNWRHYVQNVHIPGVKKFILKIEGSGTYELPEEAAKDSFPETIPQLLANSAQRFSEATALQVKRRDKWVRYSFAEVFRAANEIAHRLAGLGLRKGDRVVLFSENQPEWGISYLGASLVGLVVVPLDAQTWHREVWSVASFTSARAILASEKGYARLTPEGLATNEASSEPQLLLNTNSMCRPFGDSSYPISTCPPEPDVPDETFLAQAHPDDEASIIFTTGTTVDPKGAVHTHRSFLNNLRGVNHHLSLTADDRLLSVLPLYHALEFTCGFLMAIHRGATVTYAQSLKPRLILETMRETGTTCLLGVPTLLALIRDDLERRVLKSSKSPLKTNITETSKRLSRSVEEKLGRNIGQTIFAKVYREFGGNLRILVSGGSALGRRLYRDYRAMGLTVYEGYGLTETAPVLTVNPLHRSREGSAGKPLPGVEMRVYRPDRDGVGEIIVRTPSIMKEYFRNPEATRKAFRDGWFHTGDLGWVDADGYLYITGRSKDVIVTGAGKNVYPTDLEAIYRELPQIRDICVVGVKSGLTEDVHAVIVPETVPPVDSSPDELKRLIQREVQDFSRELPSYHRLQQIHLVSEGLPVKGDGQIDRSAVRAWVADRLNGPARPETPKQAKDLSRRDALFAELGRISGIDPSEIAEETNLYTDLGLDSLMAVELLLFIERDLGVMVSDERIAGFQIVGDILDELRRRGLSEGQDGTLRPMPIGSALPLSQRPAFDRAVLKTSFSLLKVLFRRLFHLKTVNQKALPREGAYIIAANHASHLDSAAVISALSLSLGTGQARRLHVVGARDYFFDSPFKGWLFSTCLNVVPIEREEIGLSGLRMLGKILAQGEPVLIFPEGTRSRTGELQEFKPGVGLIAWEFQAPVLPVYISGAFAAMPAGSFAPRRSAIEVRFGEIASMDDYRETAAELSRDELYRRITGDIRASIEILGSDREAE